MRARTTATCPAGRALRAASDERAPPAASGRALRAASERAAGGGGGGGGRGGSRSCMAAVAAAVVAHHWWSDEVRFTPRCALLVSVSNTLQQGKRAVSLDRVTGSSCGAVRNGGPPQPPRPCTINAAHALRIACIRLLALIATARRPTPQKPQGHPCPLQEWKWPACLKRQRASLLCWLNASHMPCTTAW